MDESRDFKVVHDDSGLVGPADVEVTLDGLVQV
jgi:hypothetical protein